MQVYGDIYTTVSFCWNHKKMGHSSMICENCKEVYVRRATLNEKKGDNEGKNEARNCPT